VLFEQNGDVFKLRISDRSIQPLLSSPAAEIFPSLSPDGRWLAYSSNDSGRFEVYVSPYPSLTGRRQVSSNRGASPVWSRGGRELLYVEPTGPPVSAPITDTFRLMTAAITSRGEPSVPRALFHKSTSEFGLPIGGPPAFAVTPEGDRLLAGVPDPARYPPPSHINVVFNWVDSLRRRMQRAAP
jgi:serine/threonine-protein kinase